MTHSNELSKANNLTLNTTESKVGEAEFQRFVSEQDRAPIVAMGAIPEGHEGPYKPSPEELLTGARFTAEGACRLAEARANVLEERVRRASGPPGEASEGTASPAIPTPAAAAPTAAATPARAAPGLMVPVYGTPRFQVLWETVYSQGVLRDVLVPDGRLDLFFGLTIDPVVRLEAGLFSLNFSLIQPPGAIYRGGSWAGWTSTGLPGGPYPGGSFWVQMWWAHATDATNGNRGLFLYRPSATFEVWFGGGTRLGRSQFAVDVNDHYVYIE